MRLPTLALVALVSVLSSAGVPGSADRAVGPPDRDTFAVYLLAAPVDQRTIADGRGDWSRVRLSDRPLISADDIISYDFATHSIRLRPDALARVPRPPVHHLPFVVVARGERIYLGVFMSSISSVSAAVPTIVVDGRALVPDQPADVLVIDRAYPSASFGVGPDPRGDRRIKDALAALGKLKGGQRGR